MEFIRKHFIKIMRNAIEMVNKDSILQNYKFSFYTDAEFVIYDDNRDLDLFWFPITTDFLNKYYKDNMSNLINSHKKILVITGNNDKFNEIKHMFRMKFGEDVYLSKYSPKNTFSPNDVELLKSSVNKIKRVMNNTRLPLLADSTGLVFENMKGFPGAQTKSVLNHIGEEGLLSLAIRNKVFAETVISYYDGNGIDTYTDRIIGKIVNRTGSNGFGWDSFFIPTSSNKTFGEMNLLEKSTFSMRTRALDNLIMDMSYKR